MLVENRKELRVWKSTDKGTSWESGQSIPKLDDSYVLARDAKLHLQNNYVVLSQGGVFQDEAFYLSEDQGSTFTKVPIEPIQFQSPVSIDIYEAHSEKGLAKIAIPHGQNRRGKGRVVLFDTQQTKLIEAPAELDSTILFDFDAEGTLLLAGHRENGKAQFWTLKTGGLEWKWSEPRDLPAADRYIEHGSRIILIQSDPTAGRLGLSIWDPTEWIVGSSQIEMSKLDEEAQTYWKDFNRSGNEKSRQLRVGIFPFGTDLNDVAHVAKINETSIFVKVGMVLTVLWQEQPTGNVTVHPLPLRSFVVGQSILVPTKSGYELRYYDENTGKLNRGPELPSSTFGEYIAHVVRRNDGWLVLSFSNQSGEKEIVVSEKGDTEETWSKRHPPEGIITGRPDGVHLPRWMSHLFEDGTIIMACTFASSASSNSQLLRSLPHKPTVGRDSGYSEVWNYLRLEVPRSVAYWRGYGQLLDNLGFYIALGEDLTDLRTTLSEIASSVEESEALPAYRTNSVPWDLITSSLITSFLPRFVILGLVFFVAKIFVNLYRYFLRLAAYYEARADGIALLTLDNSPINGRLPRNLNELFAALSPDTVDLGTPPNAPMGEILEAATRVAKASAELVANKRG